MAKLARNEMPSGHSRDDFQCFGPVASKNTEFDGCKMADMGCFKQESSDSNKFYHACVAKSSKTGKWYLYVEYGRTNDGVAVSPQYQFTECDTESEACYAFAKQCAEKNTKRGQWQKTGSLNTYVPKTKKDGSTEDLYIVRELAARSVGLPAAKNICNASAAPVVVQKASKPSKVDPSTHKLFKDLLGGTVAYTRSTMSGGTMPSLSAIGDARDLLQEAMKQVKKVGSVLQDQVADSTLKTFTYQLYSMVPKVKPIGASEDTWILSQENIKRWQDDLDAFETALKSGTAIVEDETDVLAGIPAKVAGIPLDSEMGKFLTKWWKASTRNSHGHRPLQVHNLWSICRDGDDAVFENSLDATIKEMPSKWNEERPYLIENQKERPDATAAERKKLWTANVFLGFHGTRAVNVPGIIRENLRFPNQLVGVVINGAMFGPGSYFADDWGKSANYCSVSSGNSLYAGSSGHVSGRRSFMFACDVILGHPHVAEGAHGYTKPPAGHHCVYGKKGKTKSWGGNLLNNEWIIYSKGRLRIRYLAELSWN